MTTLQQTLADIVAALTTLQARFALVGGLAVSVRTEPRFTRDVDLAVPVAGDAEAEELTHGLRGHGFRPFAHLEQEATGRLATVRLGRGDAAQVVDLLFASSGIEPELVDAAEPLEIYPGLVVPVATLPFLLALKILSREDEERPQDRVDAVALLQASSSTEQEEARRVLELIAQRGYDRGRDLLADLDALIDEV